MAVLGYFASPCWPGGRCGCPGAVGRRGGAWGSTRRDVGVYPLEDFSQRGPRTTDSSTVGDAIYVAQAALCEHCGAMRKNQCKSMRCNTKRCKSMQSNAQQCNVCKAVLINARHCKSMKWKAGPGNAKLCDAMRGNAHTTGGDEAATAATEPPERPPDVDDGR